MEAIIQDAKVWVGGSTRTVFLSPTFCFSDGDVGAP